MIYIITWKTHEVNLARLHPASQTKGTTMREANNVSEHLNSTRVGCHTEVPSLPLPPLPSPSRPLEGGQTTGIRQALLALTCISKPQYRTHTSVVYRAPRPILSELHVVFCCAVLGWERSRRRGSNRKLFLTTEKVMSNALRCRRLLPL